MEKIKLITPIMVDGNKVTEIELRTPKVRDTIAVDKSDISESEKEVRLLANLSGLSPDNIYDLDLRDYQHIGKVLSDFLTKKAV